jgi:hypothetical protein
MMLLRRRSTARHPGGDAVPGTDTGRDAGHTLVELITAMTIFTFVLATITAAVVTLSADLRKSENLSASTDAARAAFSRLDQQVRYAVAINRPVESGTDWYVEFESVDSTNTHICHQWRLVNSTDTLQQRSWPAATTPSTAPAWQTVATSVTNDPSTQPPFVFTAASASIPAQQLMVNLVVSRGSQSTGTVNLTTTFAGRNTDTATVTNPDSNNDGISDTQVCQTGVGRP